MFNIQKENIKYKMSIFGETPHFDWHVLILFVTLLFVIANAFAFYHFVSVKKTLEENPQIEEQKQNRSIDDFENLIKKIQKVDQTR